MSESKFELCSWSPVGVWKYETLDGEVKCSICKNSIYDFCVSCKSKDININTICNISQGKCKHVFHAHCIEKWVNENYTCPKDGVVWICETPSMNETGACRIHLK